MPTTLIDLTKLSEDELQDLNRRIVDRLRLIRSAKHLVQLAQFSVGMEVEFATEDGRMMRGTITRLNRQTATICCASGGHWRVSPALLRSVGRQDESATPQVVQMPDRWQSNR